MQQQISITAEPLTQSAFAPFGFIIEASAGKPIEINQGYATRMDDVARAQLAGQNAESAISFLIARPSPLRFTMLERHPLGSQSFIPLTCHDWWVVVAPEPEPSALRLFRATGNQGIQYNINTWHHPMLVDQEQTFLIIDRKGDGNNCEEVKLSIPVVAAT